MWNRKVESYQLLILLLLVVCWDIIKSFTLTTHQSTIAKNSFNLHMNDKSNLCVYIFNSMSGLKREEWNKLKGDNPFLEYDWLNIMEKSGCVDASSGWDPIHLAIGYQNPTQSMSESAIPSTHKGLDLLAALPLYVKYHSYGEFIFDQQWASFAQSSLGLKYYPKLLSAVPFTPGTGSRLLVDPSISADLKLQCYNMLIDAMKGLTINNKLLSVNVNFMLDEEVPYFKTKGFDLRQTVQYRWHNLNPLTNEKFQDFDDYLSCFKSKRRIQIRRERKSVYEDQSIRIETIRGDDEKADIELYSTIHEIYTTTVDKMWGTQYLSKEFFILLSQAPADFRQNILFIIAYDKMNKIVAGTFNLVSSTHFYGRYWGAFEYIKNLHFEACYYYAIEYCIKNGIEYMEPGAGGGEYKFLRGFDPFLINSVHYITNNEFKKAVQQFLEQERQINKEQADTLIEMSALTSKQKLLEEKVSNDEINDEKEE